MPRLPISEADPAGIATPPPPATPRTGQFPFVQAVRGLAALWVVLFHADGAGDLPHLKAALPRPMSALIFDYGHLGVAIFFALSGFVIAHSLRDVRLSWPTLGRFALRRSIRLDPPYWASMLLVVALAWLSARVKHEAWAPPSPGQIAAHILYIQEWLHVPELNTVFWTLTYEIQFYLFFALALVIGGQVARDERALPAVWALFYLVAFAAALGAFDRMPQGPFLNLWHCFFIGALAHRAWLAPRARPFLFLLGPAMLARSIWLGAGFEGLSAATALIFYAILVSGRGHTALSGRALGFLGAISYSLYLIHNPVTGATAFLLAHAGLTGTPARELALLLVIVAASLIAAAIFSRVVEWPAHRLSRRVHLHGRRAPGEQP